MLRLWFPLPQNKHTYLQKFTLYKKIEDTDKTFIKLNPGFSWKKFSDFDIDPEHLELLNVLKARWLKSGTVSKIVLSIETHIS